MLTIPRPAHEVSFHLPFVFSEFVFSHQPVPPIVDVCGVVQLQTAVILPFCDVVDHGHDVEPFCHWLIILKPL